MDAERLKHLAVALAIDPQNAVARGMMGLVAYGGRWMPPEKVGEVIKADEATSAKLAEYEAKRQATPVTADAQWELALWCEKNGLKAEATAHLTAVTRISPRRTEAWRRLGCQLYKGRWLNAEQVAAERAEGEAQKKADREWQPFLEKWKKDLVFDNPKRELALAALKDISDPRAVPSIYRVLGHGNRAQQEMAVQMLSRIECPASSHALAVFSLFDRWGEVRMFAIKELKRRDPRDFMDAMIGLMRHPFKFHVTPVGPSGEPGELVIEGERSRTKRVYEVPQIVAPNPEGLGYVASDANGSTIVLGPTKPKQVLIFLAESPEAQLRDMARMDQMAAGYMMGARARTEQTLQQDIASLKQLNAKVERANQIVGSTLAQIAGESFGGDPDVWLTWWNDQIGLRYERIEPTYKPTTVQFVPTAIVFRAHHSCFVAGTPVPTLTGPRPIESLKVGDVVLSQDTVTGTLSFQPILGVHHNPPAETLRIRLKDETLVSTPVHRYWRPGRGWAMARDLKPGDFLRTVGGRAEVVEIQPDSVQPVFNLDVARTNTFFVGSAKALVRDNSLPPSMLTPFDAEPTLASIAEPHPGPSKPPVQEIHATRAGKRPSEPGSSAPRKGRPPRFGERRYWARARSSRPAALRGDLGGDRRLLSIIPGQPSVNIVSRAGHVVGVGRGEEGGDGGHVLRLAHPPERDLLEQSLDPRLVVEQGGVDRRGDRAGGDAVDRDAASAQLDGQVAGQELEAPLAGAVRRIAGEGEFLVYGADLDDLARPLLGEQVVHERLRREEDAFEVDVQDPVIVRLRNLDEWGVLLDPGVVDEDVERPELLDRLIDQAAGLVGAGEIRLDQHATTAGRFDFGQRLSRLAVDVEIVDDDVRPLASQPDGDRPADPAAAARDHCPLADQSHRPSLPDCEAPFFGPIVARIGPIPDNLSETSPSDPAVRADTFVQVSTRCFSARAVRTPDAAVMSRSTAISSG